MYHFLLIQQHLCAIYSFRTYHLQVTLSFYNYKRQPITQIVSFSNKMVISVEIKAFQKNCVHHLDDLQVNELKTTVVIKISRIKYTLKIVNFNNIIVLDNMYSSNDTCVYIISCIYPRHSLSIHQNHEFNVLLFI